MHYVIKDKGKTQYFAERGSSLLKHIWSTEVREAIKFETVSDAASMCGKLTFDSVEIVKVEYSKPILTVM